MRTLRKSIISFFVFFAAIFLYFQEWFWNAAKPIIEKISVYKIIQVVEDWVKKLNPACSLLLFVFPAAVVQIAEIWGLKISASGSPFLGTSVYLLAKIFGFMAISRIYYVTKPKTMQIAWFKAFIDWFLKIKGIVYAKLEEVGVWKLIKRMRLRLNLFKNNIIQRFGTKRSLLSRAFSRVKTKTEEIWTVFFIDYMTIKGVCHDGT